MLQSVCMTATHEQHTSAIGGSRPCAWLRAAWKHARVVGDSASAVNSMLDSGDRRPMLATGDRKSARLPAEVVAVIDVNGGAADRERSTFSSMLAGRLAFLQHTLFGERVKTGYSIFHTIPWPLSSCC